MDTDENRGTERKIWTPTFKPERLQEAKELLSEQPLAAPTSEPQDKDAQKRDSELTCPHCGNPVYGEPKSGEIRYQGTSFDNPKFRAEVEARCPPIDTTMLSTNGRLYQTVPAFPGHLTLILRTQCAEEASRVSRLARDRDIPQLYNLFDGHILNIATTVASLEGDWIGPVPLELEDPLQASGGNLVWNEDVFMRNLNIVRTRLSTPVIQRIIPQVLWFMQRCEDFLSPDSLKKS